MRHTVVRLITCASVALLAAGCSSDPPDDSTAYADRVAAVADRAADTGKPFHLPVSTSDGKEWKQAVVVCPYDTSAPTDADSALSAAHKRQDTSDDSSQWLLLLVGNKARTVALERDDVDFCAGESVSHVAVPSTEWSAAKRDGTLEISAAR